MGKKYKKYKPETRFEKKKRKEANQKAVDKIFPKPNLDFLNIRK